MSFDPTRQRCCERSWCSLRAYAETRSAISSCRLRGPAIPVPLPFAQSSFTPTTVKRLALLLAGLSLSPWLSAAAQSAPSATTATAPARPSDVSSVDAIVAALYDANTVLVDQKRDADRFRSLFISGARLMPTAGSGNSKRVITILTVEDYVRQAASGPPRHGFSEREIARTSHAFGNIVQAFSTYETHRD